MSLLTVPLIYTLSVTDLVTPMALTDTAIRNAKPGEKHRFIADGNGLYLRIHSTGTKTFLLRSRIGGKARWVTLGEYPALSLSEARRKAADHGRSQLPARVTVQAVYDEWIQGIRRDYRSPAQVEYRVTAYLLRTHGSRPIASITRPEATQLLTDIAQRAPKVANRLTTDLKMLFAYAAMRGLVAVSPLEGVSRKAVGGKEKPRDRVLSTSELRTLLHELTKPRFRPSTRFALGLILLTGVRSAEARGVTKAEVTGNVWTIPGARTKNGITHKVDVGGVASRLLRTMFVKLGDRPLAEISPYTLSQSMRRMEFDPPATPHDLRRTMATWMADNGVAPHVVEKCLNHKMAGVMAVYNHATYDAEKANAWRKWARHLLSTRKNPGRSRG